MGFVFFVNKFWFYESLKENKKGENFFKDLEEKQIFKSDLLKNQKK